MNWYVAYTYPRCEKRVERQVKDLGVDCYLPLKKVVRRWSDRMKKNGSAIISKLHLCPNYTR